MVWLAYRLRGATIAQWATILCVGMGLTSIPRITYAIEAGELQAAIVMRALSYDDLLKSRVGNEVVVGLALPNSETPVCSLMRDGFHKVASLKVQGLPVRLVELPTQSIAALEEAMVATHTNVVVLCASVTLEISRLTDITRRLKITSVAMDPDWVRQGVALGVGEHENGKAKLFVNVPASQAEGMQLRPELLRVAVVTK